MQGFFPGSDAASLGLGSVPVNGPYPNGGVAQSPAAPVANGSIAMPPRKGNAAVAWGTILVGLIAAYFLFSPIKLG